MNCNKDAIVIDDTSHNFFPKKQFRVVTNYGNNISSGIVNYLKSKSGNNLRVNINKYSISLSDNTTAKNRSQNTIMGTVLTSKEIVVTNEYNTKHTFEVLTPSEPNSKTNLIVIETDTHIDEYFLKYTANESSTHELFSGTIESYNSTGDLIGSAIVENGNIDIVSGRLNPDCADKDDTDSADKNTNSNTNNSGGDSSIPPDSNGINNDSSGNTSQSSSNGGELTDTAEPCDLGYYYACNRGYTDYHLPRGNPKCSGNDMSGDNLIITDCNGIYAARPDIIDPCIGAAGVILINKTIFDIEGLSNYQIDWLNENHIIANELQNLLSDNDSTQDAEDFISILINELIEDEELTLDELLVQKLVVDAPEEKIENIEEFLECFDVTQGAELTIYVDQPVRGERKAWTIGGPDFIDVGHAFIQIQQGNITRVFGLYPAGLAKPTQPSDTRVYGDDANHVFDLSISKDITATQLNDIINDTIGDETNYHLNLNNCSSYAIRVAEMGGINLPSTTNNWPGGEGTNPGDLGEDIREHTQLGTTKNILEEDDYDTALGSEGNC